MEIQYLSDLHLNNYKNNTILFFIEGIIACKSDIVIIAGDISDAQKLKSTLLYITEAIPNKYFIFVPGNHDYDGSQISKINKELYNIKIKNLKILNNSSTIIDNIVFIGSSGWISEYNLLLVSRVNSYERIGDLITKYKYGTLLGKESYNFFKKELTTFNNKFKKVCITHTVPSYSLLTKYKENPLNWFFVNQLLDNIIEKYKPEFWVCGHTHENIETTLYDTKCLCNPVGIQKLPIKFDFNKKFII